MKEISGDISMTYRLNFFKKIWYLFYNFFRGLGGHFQYIKVSHWNKTLNNPNSNSPSRQQLDLFLQEELKNIINKKQVRVLDVGCGSGYLLDTFTTLGFIGKYVGVDINDNNDFARHSNTSFELSYFSEGIEKYVDNDGFDLVISNTAFEHISNDKLAKEKCDYLAKGGVQVHIVPAYASLFLYLLHGYRQYSPARIKQVLGNSSTQKIYTIGGLFSFLLHLFFITISERLTGRRALRQKNIYKKLVKACSKGDKFIPWAYTMYIIIDRKDG